MYSKDEALLSYLFTYQSSISDTPYTFIEEMIEEGIASLKANHLNGRIINAAININGKLVLVQLYIQRLNGFTHAGPDAKFGTNPTSYHIQVRFPFGGEFNLENENILIPCGDFKNILSPYMSRTGVAVIDDLKHDYSFEDIKTHGVTIKKEGQNLVFTCVPHGQSLTIRGYSEELGKGYDKFSGNIEYKEISDYINRTKKAGISSLFNFSMTNYRNQALGPPEVLLYRADYQGYTEYQGRGEIERFGQENSQRLEKYHNFLLQRQEEILNSEAGKDWKTHVDLSQHSPEFSYLFDIIKVEGVQLFTNSGLPLIKLYPYQLEVIHNFSKFIAQVAYTNHTSDQAGPGLTARISLAVGLGKTFLSYIMWMLQRYLGKKDGNILPTYFLTPNEAIAQVTQKELNTQGASQGMYAACITKKEDLPNDKLLALYKKLAQQAHEKSASLKECIHQGRLQRKLLQLCLARNLHPHNIISLLGNIDYPKSQTDSAIEVYNNSIDIKRLLLLIEGQSTIKKYTGVLDTTILKNLANTFDKLITSSQLEKQKPDEDERDKRNIFKDSEMGFDPFEEVIINYNQTVELPPGVLRGWTEFYSEYNFMTQYSEEAEKYVEERERLIRTPTINMANINKYQLFTILRARYSSEVSIRDQLVKLACLRNVKAATLLANSGGLGSTSTSEEIQQQIKEFLPDAVEEIQRLASKASLTFQEHYLMKHYLFCVFAVPPKVIDFTEHEAFKNVSLHAGRRQSENSEKLYRQGIKDLLEIIAEIKQEIQVELDRIPKVNQLNKDDQALLKEFNINPEDNIMEVTNQLAGIINLQITTESSDDRELLWTHTQVFTPEGLVAFFEHLGCLVNKPKIHFKKEGDIYLPFEEGINLKSDVEAKLKALLHAVVISDEIHKPEFQFLYDSHHPLYQRINRVTQAFLNQEFLEVLPHRIGMSGSMNNEAKKAFGKDLLYDLSIQKSIKIGITKQISSNTHTYFSEEELAKRIVIDYFAEDPISDITDETQIKKLSARFNLFNLSKGIIFSKKENPIFNQKIVDYFNVLIKTEVTSEEKQLQEELLQEINEKRHLILGQILTVRKLNDDQRFYKSDLTPENLRKAHQAMWRNNTVAFYMEYILSKSTTPMNFTDIVGLQNRIFFQEYNLDRGSVSRENTCKNLIRKDSYAKDLYLSEFNLIELPQVKGLLELLKKDRTFQLSQAEKTILKMARAMEKINNDSITENDLKKFFQERIADEEQRNFLIATILQYKSDFGAFASNLNKKCPLSSQLITNSRAEFEAGKASILIGSPNERTGYSHPPTGIIVDVPTYTSVHIDKLLNGIENNSFDEKVLGGVWEDLVELTDDSFPYDEKNQVGGRALRTPFGYTRYVEYQSNLNLFLEKYKACLALQAFKVETQFEDIFTTDQNRATEIRDSVNFNRETIILLKRNKFPTIRHFTRAVKKRFRDELLDEDRQLKFNQFIDQRLPLLWSLKEETSLAKEYFLTLNENVFEAKREELHNPLLFNEEEDKNKVINRGDFLRLLHALDIQIAQLKNKKRDVRYSKVVSVAIQLDEKLSTAEQTYFQALPKTAQEDLEKLNEEFKTACFDAIRAAKEEFGSHRGFGKIHPILRKILGLFSWITIIPLYATKEGYIATFFKDTPTSSAKYLQAFEKGIEESFIKLEK